MNKSESGRKIHKKKLNSQKSVSKRIFKSISFLILSVNWARMSRWVRSEKVSFQSKLIQTWNFKVFHKPIPKIVRAIPIHNMVVPATNMDSIMEIKRASAIVNRPELKKQINLLKRGIANIQTLENLGYILANLTFLLWLGPCNL